MTSFDIPIFIAFWLLITLSLKRPNSWQQFRQKPLADWTLDLCGLAVQGILIPILQIGLLHQGLHHVISSVQNSLTLPAWASFLLCVVCVDYGYYWNHRWLHRFGWPLHKVHHTVTQLDVLGSSRNSAWSSFFILYIWVHALMIYLLQDASGYLWGISLTAVLDLWRHSRIAPNPRGWLYPLLSPWLVLPQDHAQHHSKQPNDNFGANLKIWDRIHGTAKDCSYFPKQLGLKTSLTFWQQLLYPFSSP